MAQIIIFLGATKEPPIAFAFPVFIRRERT